VAATGSDQDPRELRGVSYRSPNRYSSSRSGSTWWERTDRPVMSRVGGPGKVTIIEATRAGFQPRVITCHTCAKIAYATAEAALCRGERRCGNDRDPGWLAGLRAGRCHTREPRHCGCRGRGHTTIPCKRSPAGSPNPLLSRPHEPLGPLSRRRALPGLQPPYAKAPGDPHSHRSRSARRVGAVAGLIERWARGEREPVAVDGHPQARPCSRRGVGADQADVKSREVYGNRRLRGLRRRSCGFASGESAL